MGDAWNRRSVGLSVAALVAIIGLATLSLVRAADPATPTTRPADGASHMVTVRVVQPDGTLSPAQSVPKFTLSDAEWRKRLTPEQYRITRNSGTEPAFCGGLLKNKESGLYVCVGCGLPLFRSETKFESGTGWPSFYQPAVPENVSEKEDRSYGMVRTEINCARCDGHLGHVFDDGPRPTGRRFCLNSESLRFVKYEDAKSLAGIDGNATTQPAATR
jgi:methionine-R-sulfoxide reductase